MGHGKVGILVTHTAREPEEVGLSAHRVGRAVVRPLQGIGNSVETDGVVGGVGVDVVTIAVEEVVEVVVREPAVYVVEVEGVAERAVITPLLVPDVHVVEQLRGVRIEVRHPVLEHDGVTAQVAADVSVGVARVAVGEACTVLQTAVFRELAMVVDVGEQETVNFVRCFVTGYGAEVQVVDVLADEVAFVARAVEVDHEVGLPDMLRMRRPEVELLQDAVVEVDIREGGLQIVNFQILHPPEIERVGECHPGEAQGMAEVEEHVLVRLSVDAERLVEVAVVQQRVIFGNM